MIDRVTVEWLRERYACEEQVELFAAAFGAAADISRANAALAARAGLDLDWLANELLGALALRAYKKARATAWRAYKEAAAPARRAYSEAKTPAWQAYPETTATAWRGYDEAKATALCDAIGLPPAEGQVAS